MSNSDNTDNELDKYLEGDSNLSETYRSIQDEGPSIKLDEKILTAARKEVEAHTPGLSRRPWMIPVALAASLVLGILALQFARQDTVPVPEPIAGDSQHQPLNEHDASAKTAPEIMLEKINRLLADGKQEEAEVKFQSFRQVFPEYRIDFEKYPALKHLESD